MFKNSAKITIAFYLFLLIFLTGSCSSSAALSASNNSNSNTQKTDKRISLFDNRVSFVPPDGFKPVKIEEVKKKLADNDAPKNIFANENQSAYITIYFGDFDLEDNQLNDTKKFVEGTHRNFSSWKTSEIIELNGKQWFHFEWEKPAADKNLVAPVAPDEEKKPEVEEKPIYYREYTTSLNKKNLRFVFEAATKDYPQIKEAFNKSIQTIQVKEK